MDSEHDGRRSRWWAWIIAGVAVVIIGVAVTAWGLIGPLAEDDPSARVSAVQATFTITFGVGGLATLALFARRQWLQERIHEHERFDAKERRITEQYIKAVEQLGHDKAPVRLGGLFALDRLGRAHPEQRHVISEVFSAYLRRRYTPPPDIIGGDDADGESEGELSDDDLQKLAEAADEYEVRMTAQHLLIRHLEDLDPAEDEADQHWDLSYIDLRGATLINADFSQNVLPTLIATGAHFYGMTDFTSAKFTGPVSFGRAHFHGTVLFRNADFREEAGFSKAQFHSYCNFVDSETSGEASFSNAIFRGLAFFDGMKFQGAAWFAEAQFLKSASFDNAKFFEIVGFDDLITEEQARITMSRAEVMMFEVEDEKQVLPPGWVLAEAGDHWVVVPEAEPDEETA